MDSLVEDAIDLQYEAEWRASAHDRSAKWHRKWAVRLGAAATILSAIVGLSIFGLALKKFGLDGNGNTVIPLAGIGAQITFYFVVGCSILSPILGALQTFLNEREEVEKHLKCATQFTVLRFRLAEFLDQYSGGELSPAHRGNARKELTSIAAEIEKSKEIVVLTSRAEEHAKGRTHKLAASPRANELVSRS